MWYNYFVICLSENGDLYSFGSNEFGQLGLGNNEGFNSPQKVETVQDIDFIECGEYHSICKTNSGEFYCWGRNNHGQLGIGNSDNQKLLFQCLNWQDIVDIKCGAFHTLALTTNQEVYSCGENLSGQLGRLANDDSALKLLQVEELSNIIIIRCGSSHSMCVDIHNNLFLFGDNTFGQLGFGDSVNRIKPEIHSNLQQIIDVSSGGYHTFVKTISNEVIAFGWNDSEQLGIETKYKYQFNPITLSKDIENIWCSNINKKSSAKSARK